MAKKLWFLVLLVLILGSPAAILAVSPLEDGTEHEGSGETERAGHEGEVADREATEQETAETVDHEATDQETAEATDQETGEREVPDNEISDAAREFAKQIDATIAEHESKGEMGESPADHVDFRVTESEDGSQTVHLDYTNDDDPPN